MSLNTEKESIESFCFSNHNPFMEEFNCRGKLSSMTIESVRPDPDQPAQQEEQRLFVAKLFYDNSGLLIQRQESRKTTFYHYNDDHLLEKEVEVRNDEQISRERIYQYSAGRLLTEIQDDEKISYHYSNKDILNFTTTWSSGIQETICSYGYDEYKNVILKEIRDPEGVLLRSCRLKRNMQGLISKETVINQDNMILEQTKYEYTAFHGENWLKRESYRIEEKQDPVIIEILYRNISLASSGVESAKNQSSNSEPPEDTIISLPDHFESKPSTTAMATVESIDDAKSDIEIQEEEVIPAENEVMFKNGRYKGSVNCSNIPDGQGEFWGRDGSRYSGTFSNGHLDGNGNLLHKNGSSYTGQFKNGLPHGEGECLWPNGSRYRGQFVQGEMHGIGSFTWSDGTRFTGLFEHNKSTDQGLLENAENPGEES
ncbi:hypothetical protein DV872_07600 [Oceanispirochaeta sp. M1]|nr:hypothetical protein DV872_07600 [Oceanispirochaeta sp. M1]